MKYLAILDESLLPEFTLDNKRSVIIVTDKKGFNWGIKIQPINNEMLVTVDGEITDLDKHDEDIIKQTVHSIWAKDTISQMRAMLSELKDEIKYCEVTGLWKANYREGFNDGVSKSLDAIQQKINTFKENKDEV